MKRLRLVLARVESVGPDGSAVLKPLAGQGASDPFSGAYKRLYGSDMARLRQALEDDARIPLAPMRARREET